MRSGSHNAHWNTAILDGNSITTKEEKKKKKKTKNQKPKALQRLNVFFPTHLSVLFKIRKQYLKKTNNKTNVFVY
jgi:hypothetical protein